MKRKIGIGLLIILNLTFIYLIVMGVILNFGSIVLPLGVEGGLDMANQTTNDILIALSIGGIIMISLNYFLILKLITKKNSLVASLIITIIDILIFTPFFLSSKQSFIDYQNGTTVLQHYLESGPIDNVQIITSTDTIQIEELDEFIIDIGSAQYKKDLGNMLRI